MCVFRYVYKCVVLRFRESLGFPSISLSHVFSDSSGMMKLPRDHVLKPHLPSGILANRPKMLFTCVNCILTVCMQLYEGMCAMAGLWRFKDTLGFGPHLLPSLKQGLLCHLCRYCCPVILELLQSPSTIL